VSWGGKAKEQVFAQNFVTVRIYAHPARENRQPGDRQDFTETLFWSAGLKTNEQGVAVAEFDLSDAVTSFQVSADAYTSEGAIGGGTERIESVEPFYIEPKLPLEVTTGDYILVPVLSQFDTDSARRNSSLRYRIDLAKIEGSDLAAAQRTH
jgi:uncharacterized protein YfaS (alpha-2-macroglobulin family)